MTCFLIALAVVLVMLLLFIWFCSVLDLESADERARREQAQTEANIDADHQAARRAMNDAAGQSWRNLAE